MSEAKSFTPFRTPVAVFLFNRPAHAQALLAALRPAAPRRLLLVADGPRPGVPSDAERCAAARAVFAGVDWDCDIITNFADSNQGPKGRFDSGMPWVFEHVERAIILEDDCVPGPAFFAFCEELLERYAEAEQVWTISGSQLCPAGYGGPESYYFSRYPLCWGWATWRRAWRQNDPDMSAWPRLRDTGWLDGWLADPIAARYWAYIFETTYRRRHAWDYPWVLSSWRQNALSVHPRVNLVSNTGFGPDSTHTHDAGSPLANLPRGELDFPLRHPAAMGRDPVMDKCLERFSFSGNLQRVMENARAIARSRRGQAHGD